MKTINVLPDDWLTSEQTAAFLGMSQRTVQEMGKDGRLKTKPSPDNPRLRLYDAQDVEEMKMGPRRKKEAPVGEPGTALTRTLKKRPSQDERALDLVSLTGQFLAYMKAEHESARQRQEAEENRRRAEMEDARERWEAEQKLRLAAAEREEMERQRKQELEKPWLTLASASELSGLTRRQVRELCEGELLVAVNNGGWRINRASLMMTFDGGPMTVSRAQAAQAKREQPKAKAKRAHA